MIAFMATLDGNVVDVALDGLSGELGENLVRGPLIGGTGVLQSKRHDGVAEYSKRCPKGGVPLVIRVHFDLIVPGESIHEGHTLIAGHVVHHDIGDGQRELILRTCVVEVAEVDADADCSVLLSDGDDIQDPIGVLFLTDKPRVYKLSDLLFNGIHYVGPKAPLGLFDWLCTFSNVKMVHCHLWV